MIVQGLAQWSIHNQRGYLFHTTGKQLMGYLHRKGSLQLASVATTPRQCFVHSRLGVV